MWLQSQEEVGSHSEDDDADEDAALPSATEAALAETPTGRLSPEPAPALVPLPMAQLSHDNDGADGGQHAQPDAASPPEEEPPVLAQVPSFSLFAKQRRQPVG